MIFVHRHCVRAIEYLLQAVIEIIDKKFPYFDLDVRIRLRESLQQRFGSIQIVEVTKSALCRPSSSMLNS